MRWLLAIKMLHQYFRLLLRYRDTYRLQMITLDKLIKKYAPRFTLPVHISQFVLFKNIINSYVVTSWMSTEVTPVGVVEWWRHQTNGVDRGCQVMTSLHSWRQWSPHRFTPGAGFMNRRSSGKLPTVTWLARHFESQIFHYVIATRASIELGQLGNGIVTS